MLQIIGLILLVALGIGAFVLYDNGRQSSPEPATTQPATNSDSATPVDSVKEFETTAYYDEQGAWYSLKEIRVKRGDRIRIRATNTKGMHDFVIDELGVKQELPLNEEVSIEFVASKAGEFVFYCSKLGHRAKGQWGKLIVE